MRSQNQYPPNWKFFASSLSVNHSGVVNPLQFLCRHSTLFPKCFAEPLRRAALEMQAAIGDYDAVHIRRGDKLTGYPSR